MPIRTAILGYGRSGGSLHADPIEALPDFALAAVCDVDPAAREKAGARFGCRLYGDYRAMLRDEDLDLVVVVTRSDQHAQMACDCLRAGKNVLVTKPWARDEAQAREMIAAAKESGKLLLPWLPARWGSDLARLRELTAGGAVGRVFQIRRGEYTFGVRSDWQTKKACAGGYLLNWGPHIVDQAVQLGGSPVRSACAQLRQVINPGDVEDVFCAMLRNRDDAILITEFNIAAPGLPKWVVQGDRGTIFGYADRLELYKATLPESPDGLSYRSDTKIERSVIEYTPAEKAAQYGDNKTVYAAIARAVRGEEPFPAAPENALALTRTLDAIRASGESGKTVEL